jgi:hypothetical protein
MHSATCLVSGISHRFSMPPSARAWQGFGRVGYLGNGARAAYADSSLAILSIHARKSHCRTYSRRPRRKHLGPRPCARSKSRVDGGKSAYKDTSSQDRTGLPIRSARRCTRSSERVLPAVDIAAIAPAAPPLSSIRCRFAVMTRSILLRTDCARARPIVATEQRPSCGNSVECNAPAPEESGISEIEYPRVAGCLGLRPFVLLPLKLSYQFQTNHRPQKCTSVSANQLEWQTWSTTSAIPSTARMCPGCEEVPKRSCACRCARVPSSATPVGRTITRTARCSNEPLKAHGDASARRPFSATRDVSARSPGFLPAARQLRSADSRPLLSAARLVPLVPFVFMRHPIATSSGTARMGRILAFPATADNPKSLKKVGA